MKVDEILTQVQAGLEKMLGRFAEVPAEEVSVEEEVEMADETSAEEPTEEAPAESKTDEIKSKTIEDIVDLSKNGYYNISVSVQDGIITWGSVTTEAYEELSAQKVEMAEEVKKLANSVNELEKAYEVKLAEAKASYEVKLAEIGKTAGESKVIQAPVADKTPASVAQERFQEAKKRAGK